jgi:hypothetical protein
MRARRAERGVLLVDALVALSFFAVILGGWVTLTNMKSRTIGEADRRFRATQAAQSMLALARDGLLKPGQHDEIPVDKKMFGADLQSKRRDDGLTELTAIVTWTEPGQGQQSVRLSTLSK